ncbi:MAG: slipin family protein [Armatimonadetes bacterium]|nr:slipin family protein [Anaerolineae bacterium]
MTDRKDIIIKDTHRGLWYEDGVLKQLLTAGYYELPKPPRWWRGEFGRKPKVEVVLVDVRERDLTIKGQEILTKDKVAIRVSIIVRFRVTDPRAAVQEVENYEDRIYSDVQLAARRSLSSMILEDIMTNRNQLSEDILAEVTESAAGYGVSIKRADVKDLIFPGNLQEIMNRVLTAERMSEARIIEARAKAEVDRIEALNRAETQRTQAEANAESLRLNAQADVEAQRIRTQSDGDALQRRQEMAVLYAQYPSLVRMLELETLRELAKAPNARLYINFNRDEPPPKEE